MRLTTHGTDSGFEPFHGTRRMTNATSGRDSSTVTKGMTHHQRPAEDVDAQLRKNSAPAGVCSRLCDGEARNSGLPIRQGLCVHIDPCASHEILRASPQSFNCRSKDTPEGCVSLLDPERQLTETRRVDADIMRKSGAENEEARHEQRDFVESIS